MELWREIMSKLEQWKASERRKPLIIQGARQIGKTWIMQKFGATHYEHVAYFNFDSSEELCREFERTKEPSRLLGILQLYAGVPIEPGRTLLIFDEIQQSNKALNSLKYFCEQAPEYHIVAAGSLLGVSLSRGDSFPVGKVDFLRMYPLTFREFLRADSRPVYDYIESLTTADEPLPEIAMGKATEAFRRYLVCGGMPAAAAAMLAGEGVTAVTAIQKDVLTAYTLDFAKHAPPTSIPRVAAIWQSLPSQLSRENRKFLYRLVKPGARAREYEDALLWLEHAGLIYRIFCVTKPGLPITAYDNLSAFKIYACDVGLLRAMSGLPVEALWTHTPLYKEFKGALAENVVLQSLASQFDPLPRYWTSSGTAEVDFLLQHGIDLSPVEVKAGESLNGKSLAVYTKNFAPQLAIRFSMRNLKKDGIVLNLPLFMADWTKKLCEQT